MIRPTRRFYLIVGLLLVTAVTATATGFHLFSSLILILLVTIGVSFLWNWLMIVGITARTNLGNTHIESGSSINETVLVKNRSVIPKYGLEIRDLTDMPGYKGGVVATLRTRSSSEFTLKPTSKMRGKYKAGLIEIANIDPFGLFRFEITCGVNQEILVLPRIHNLPEFYITNADLSGDSSIRKRSSTVTPHASSVRDYASGDSLSRVHWGTSARMGKLMSKEFDLGSASEVWIISDLDKSINFGYMEESTDEYAASIAASLSKKYIGSNLPVGLIAYGEKRYFQAADTGAGHLNRLVEYLAMSRCEGDTSLESVLSNEEPLWTHLTTLVVITSSPRTQWSRSLRALARRGVRPIVVLIEANSFGAPFNTIDVLSDLNAIGVPVYIVRKGDNIQHALGIRSSNVHEMANKYNKE